MAEQLEINWVNQGATEGTSQSQTAVGVEEAVVIPQELSEMSLEISPAEVEDNAPATKTDQETTGPQQRIQLLEQALEQCQLYIDELKSKLMDQAFLEEQLATTEEFSHIQKQAVITLQDQLTNREQIQQELENLRQAKIDLTNRLADKDTSLRFQEAELSKLQDQFAEERTALERLQDQAERLSLQIQSSQKTAVHETQQRIIAQTTAERLRTQLRECEADIQTLEVQLQQARESYATQQDIIASLKNADKSDSHKNQAIQSLSSSLLKAQNKIADLETQLSNQSIVQAQFQHSTQEFAEQAQSLQKRSEELEQQVAEMQEQILHQAQQASEYETAVQHWKDRSFTAEQTVAQMKQILEHLLADRKGPELPLPEKLDDAIAALSQTCLSEDTATTRKNIKLDLPALLHRWRNTKT
ncbi:coiled-coil domain-containing protein [Acaryochloris marina]|uniref:Uncharacterized protein n=1 Tax=Acaryochloris marina (strain MBIC 11017) TaxID=329726 RepID=B0CEU0_ACAM1|nr:hypothetical protein [Acaryochloris marina]ABW29337.1 hypothetical protein AM1_4358 [Acaryochloris marina MBIC11017]BDM78257.1 hypothetical protein AM10699_11270 [Acaryochloris marina MBIC10699]